GRSLDSAITKPPGPAGTSVTSRADSGFPPSIAAGPRPSRRRVGGRTVTVTRFAVPLQLAVTVPRRGPGTGELTRAKPAVVAPSAKVTAAGAVSAGLVVEIVTNAPPAGAGAVSVTVPVTFCTPPTGEVVSTVS